MDDGQMSLLTWRKLKNSRRAMLLGLMLGDVIDESHDVSCVLLQRYHAHRPDSRLRPLHGRHGVVRLLV